MLTVEANTTLIGVSELRTGVEKILKRASQGVVIVEKHHRPAAVLMSNREYQRMKEVYDLAEDLVLGHLADQRFHASRAKDYVDIEKLLK
jgi:prevent-host-death family protein